MTRKILDLAYITNDSTRRATYNKRKKGLVKKVRELTTLCGTEACVVIYPPRCDSHPEVWPSDVETNRMLSEFKESPNVAQNNLVVNPGSFLRQTLGKSFQILQKHCEDNREKALNRVIFQNLSGKNGLQGLRTTDLKDLWWLIDQNVKEINKRVDTLIEANSH